MTNKPFGTPTRLFGIEFRSRLEARWACFFEKCGWKWKYEPIILPGWLPDFWIDGYDGTGKKSKILVEVKPFCDFDQWKEMIEKIEAAVKGTNYDRNEILLLGLGPFGCAGDLSPMGNCAIGWLSEYLDSGPTWAEAAFNRGPGFFSSLYTFRDRITNLYEGDHFVSNIHTEDGDELWLHTLEVIRLEERLRKLCPWIR